MIRLLFASVCFLVSYTLFAGEKVSIDNQLESELIGKKVYYLEDKGGTLTFDDVKGSGKFLLAGKDIVNFQVSKSTFWLRVTISNKDNTTGKYIEIAQPLLDAADFYYPTENGAYKTEEYGMRFPFKQRKYSQSVNFLYDLDLKPGEEKTYYFRIQSKEQILLPVKVLTSKVFYSNTMNINIWFGIYCGIIIIMFMYNLFVYLSVKDKSYLYYVLHTLFVGITQASLAGFTYKYLWPDSPWFGNYSVFLFTCLVSIVGVEFLIEFMLVKKRAPRLLIVLRVFQLIYVAYMISSLLGFYSATYGAILSTQSVIALFILSISIYLYRKGYAESKYYLIGWASFMIAIIVYVTKDFGLLPYNNFTAYSLWIGSVVEIMLLSFALADKINIFRKDKEASQEQALAALEENARIISEQNVILETKVNERTVELSQTNNELTNTLKELKEAEAQLVESEKMASLGQLTAGIAHEINNPINFVTSNVRPLRRDIEMIIEMLGRVEEISLDASMDTDAKKRNIDTLKEDMDFDYLKEEITYLLNGITDGSNRTAEIVKGLRIFSRLDEDDLKMADINEGLDSTLVIVRNTLGSNIDIVKEYGNIPIIECYPGKLNQVFLNIITNGLQAINEKFKEEKGGALVIKTQAVEGGVKIIIKDNGMGMDEATKKKVFEPFFTTKPVGEGTGLGMSIVYNTINKHNGKIEFDSVKGEGTEFIITLPATHVVKQTEE